MNLTPLQLQIQEWSDHSLSFGCIIKPILEEDYRMIDNEEYARIMDDEGNIEVISLDEYNKWDWIVYDPTIEKVIWHPMDYGRLCYLHQTRKGKEVIEDWIKIKMKSWMDLCFCFEDNHELYNQTVLERPIKTQDYVRDFLLLLSEDSKSE